jgi:hypothetical protein
MGDSTPGFSTGCVRLGVCEFSPSARDRRTVVCIREHRMNAIDYLKYCWSPEYVGPAAKRR